MNNYKCLCVFSLSKLCLSIIDLNEDHITFYDQLLQKTRSLKALTYFLSFHLTIIMRNICGPLYLLKYDCNTDCVLQPDWSYTCLL